MAVDPNVPRLRAEARRCRDMARQLYTQETRKMMLRMADEYDAEADRLEREAKQHGPTIQIEPEQH
jgi:hypothetical protein